MSTHATLDAPSGKPPVLHQGECDPAVIRNFELAVTNYATLKGLDTDKEIMEVVIGCFRHHVITDWLSIPDERARVLALPFAAFMKELREQLLPPDWERTLRLSMLNRRHQSPEPFYTFVIAIRAQNSLLSGSPSHLTDDGLRSHLETTMCKDLMEDYDSDATAKSEKTFALWLAAVKRVDDKRRQDISRIHAAAAEERDRRERDRKRRPDDDGDRPSKKSNSQNVPPTSGPSSSGSGKRCPALTDAEKDLLDSNFGCRKCRKPFVDHRSSDNMCDFPPPLNYKPVSAAVVKSAFAALPKNRADKYEAARAAKAASVAAAVTDAAYVAAVLPDIEDGDDSGTTDGDISNRR